MNDNENEFNTTQFIYLIHHRGVRKVIVKQKNSKII